MKIPFGGTFLVVQWLRIHLPTQGMQVQSLAGELRSHMPYGNKAHMLQLQKPTHSRVRALQPEKPPLPQLEKALMKTQCSRK